MGKAKLMHIETRETSRERWLVHPATLPHGSESEECMFNEAHGLPALWVGDRVRLERGEVETLHACLGYWLKTGRLPESVENIEEDPQDDEEGARDAENADLDRMVTLMVALLGKLSVRGQPLGSVAEDAISLLTAAKRALSQENP